MAVKLYDAINLFKASQTGRGNLGTSDQRALARSVVTKLWRLRGEDEIDFSHDSAFGVSGGLRSLFGADVRLHDPTVGGDAASASIILVHEAVHLLIDRHYLDEELACRGLQLLYYAELLPPGVTYYDESRRRRVGMLRVGSVIETDLAEQARWARPDQLIDVLISRVRDYRESLTAEWVVRNARNFGGPRNRWASTIGHFLGVLAHPPYTSDQAGLIVELLEAAAATPANWPALVAAAGGDDTVRRAIHFALYSIPYYERLRAVQARVGGSALGLTPA